MNNSTSNRLNQWTTFGTITGALLGLFLGWHYGTAMEAVKWMGDIFLNALKFIVLPLVISALIVGVSGLGDVRKLGRFGGATLLYFFATTAISVFIGLLLVMIIKPGVGMSVGDVEVPSRILAKSDFGIGEFILNFLGGGPGNKHPNLFYSLTHMEMLPVVIFSLIFGLVLTTLGDVGKPVLGFFKGAYAAILKIVHGIIFFAPFGVFGLVAGKVGSLGGGEAVLGELGKVGMYTTTVVSGLLIHGFVVLPLLLFFFTGRSPVEFFKGMADALLTAFSTASSAATLPVTTRCIIEKNNVSEKATNFVLPVGATINMDGTALYEGVAVVFIAQALGVELGLSQILLIFIMAILAAMAAAAIPEAGLVTMVVILQALDLPVDAIGLLLAVDWFLDRCRTTVNVWGDSVGAAVMEKVGKTSSKVRLEAV